MRAMSDGFSALVHAVEIIMQIEEDHEIEIPDSAFEHNGAWEKMTIRHLVVATDKCLHSTNPDQVLAEGAVVSAIKKQCPFAPDTLEFDRPLLDAILPDRDYGSLYD